jgi:hypothetical protein
MADYTYDRYTKLARKFARLCMALADANNENRYTDEMLQIRAKLLEYQAYEDKHCKMWRPWETLVQHVVEEYNGDGVLFTDNCWAFYLLESEDEDEESEEE